MPAACSGDGPAMERRAWKRFWPPFRAAARSDPGPDLLFEVLTVRVAFLALEDSDYMTGQAINVTGGSVMH